MGKKNRAKYRRVIPIFEQLLSDLRTIEKSRLEWRDRDWKVINSEI